MKLRIKGNSIRLRLTMSEVENLTLGRTIREQTAISPFITFSYSLETWNMLVFGVKWEDHSLHIFIPEREVTPWASSDQETITGEIENGTKEMLSLCIEKDFNCLKEGTNQDEADYFPHPHSGISKC